MSLWLTVSLDVSLGGCVTVSLADSLNAPDSCKGAGVCGGEQLASGNNRRQLSWSLVSGAGPPPE